MERIEYNISTGEHKIIPLTQVEIDAAIAASTPTQQQQRDAISNAIQKMLDEKAVSLRYKNIDSVAKYIGYTNAFQTEAIKLASWAALCWETAGSVEAQVNAGTLPMPTVEQALAMMPAYE